MEKISNQSMPEEKWGTTRSLIYAEVVEKRKVYRNDVIPSFQTLPVCAVHLKFVSLQRSANTSAQYYLSYATLNVAL